MDDVRTRWLRPGQRPVANPGGASGVQLCQRCGRQTRLLTHDDVITLFHEFGHGLHHMLTQVNERDVSGIGGWNGMLSSCPASSWKTSAGSGMCSSTQLPRRHRRAAAARPVRQDDCRQELPERHADAAPDRVLAVRHAAAHRARPGARISCPCWSWCAPKSLYCNHRRSAALRHFSATSFAGGYAAGYYSYKWAEVLSARCLRRL